MKEAVIVSAARTAVGRARDTTGGRTDGRLCLSSSDQMCRALRAGGSARRLGSVVEPSNWVKRLGWRYSGPAGGNGAWLAGWLNNVLL